jgi:hypothetical protein
MYISLYYATCFGLYPGHHQASAYNYTTVHILFLFPMLYANSLFPYFLCYPLILKLSKHSLDFDIYLTAIGMPPGVSSTVHIYTQTIHRTTQSTQTTHRTTQFTN